MSICPVGNGVPKVLIGDGHKGRSVGPARSCLLSQPTGIMISENNIYICDSATNRVLLCARTAGTVKLYEHFGKVYDAFNIHMPKSADTSTLSDAISLMTKVVEFDKKLKQDIREKYNLRADAPLQGPEGAMSTVFSQSVSSTLICLESLSADFPTLINKMKTAVLGTKPNEALFSTTREHIMTPDALEFAIIFPKIVNKHIKMIGV